MCGQIAGSNFDKFLDWDVKIDLLLLDHKIADETCNSGCKANRCDIIRKDIPAPRIGMIRIGDFISKWIDVYIFSSRTPAKICEKKIAAT
jgi:hypothetical protein